MANKQLDDEEILEYLDEATLDRLRSGAPDAYYTIVEGTEGPVAVVFNRFTKAQLNRAQAMLKDKNRADKMAQTAFKDIIVHPQGEPLTRLLEACPLLDDQVVALATELARGQLPDEAKKLRPSSNVRAKGTPPSTASA